MTSVAVCLLHSYANATHERRVADLVREVLDVEVVLSCDIWPEVREFERATTTAMSAFVRPVMTSYLADLETRLRAIGLDAPLYVMESSGGVMPVDLASRRAVATIESGPAAGAIAAQVVGTDLGRRDVIAFDMGGTTAKAAVIRDGRPDVTHQFQVGGRGSFGTRRSGTGVPIKTPTIDLAEVGAGGGSIAWVDDAGALHVGPRSAGADPGPACYGLGGTAPTVTDANVVLGLLDPAGFDGEALPFDAEASRHAIDKNVAQPLGVTVERAAAAIHEIANATMAGAIQVVTVQRGIDPRGFALVASGGAGPLHAARIAERFDISTVIVPPACGVASALGLLASDLRTERVRSVGLAGETARLDHLTDRLDGVFEELESLAARDLAGQDRPENGKVAATDEPVRFARSIDVRYPRQAHELGVTLAGGPITAATLGQLGEDFVRRHREAFGVGEAGPIELVSVRTRATRAVPHARFARPRPGATRHDSQTTSGRLATSHARGLAAGRGVADHGADLPARCLRSRRRSRVRRCSSHRRRPCSSRRAGRRVGESQAVVLEAGTGRDRNRDRGGTRTGELEDEVIRYGLAAGAEEAAIAVVRAARSQFIVEGSDAGVAILDRHGELVARAAATSILHSGGMAEQLAAVLEDIAIESMRPDDVYITNDPYRGGVHANDIMLCRPVFVDGTVRYFTASLIHVLDLGGAAHGGINAQALETFEEGLQIPPMYWARQGVRNEDLVRIITLNSRSPAETVGDIDALAAGTLVAARRVDDMIREHGADAFDRTVERYLEQTEALTRAGIDHIPDGNYRGHAVIDDDGLNPGRSYDIHVEVRVRGDSIQLDFAGTSPQVRAPINSSSSQALDAAIFGVRCFLDRSIPMNAGCFRPVDAQFPHGSLLDPEPPNPCGGRMMAVYAVVDAIIDALSQAVPDRMIAGSGILHAYSIAGVGSTYWLHNSFDFGGVGATNGRDGVDATGLHFGVGRNQIPQVEPVEARCRLRVEAQEIITDSGGAGSLARRLGRADDIPATRGRRRQRAHGPVRVTTRRSARRPDRAGRRVLAGDPGRAPHPDPVQGRQRARRRGRCIRRRDVGRRRARSSCGSPAGGGPARRRDRRGVRRGGGNRLRRASYALSRGRPS